jgi:hypothetical protein
MSGSVNGHAWAGLHRLGSHQLWLVPSFTRSPDRREARSLWTSRRNVFNGSVFENPSADIGAQPDQVIDGGVLWVRFELGCHAQKNGAGRASNP